MWETEDEGTGTIEKRREREREREIRINGHTVVPDKEEVGMKSEGRGGRWAGIAKGDP